MATARHQSGFAAPARALAAIRDLFAAAEGRAPADIRDELAVAQFQRLNAHVPELFLAMALIVVAATLALLGDLPWYQQFLPPAALLGATGVLMYQRHVRPLVTNASEARRLLRDVPAVAGAMGLVTGLWCVSAFTETETYYCVVAPVFLSLAVLMAVHFLASVPNAAAIAAIATVSPISVKMLMFDNLGIRCIAIMMIVITTMQLRLIYRRFDETIEVMRLQRDLGALAATDPLTGLANRRVFDVRLERALSAGAQVTVAMLDLDGFKGVNDRRGHQAGDAVLIEVARRLRLCCPGASTIARLGGDEFALLYGPAVSAADALDEAEAGRRMIAMPIDIDGDAVLLGASLGLASGNGQAKALVRRADDALYADKANRRSLLTSMSATLTKVA